MDEKRDPIFSSFLLFFRFAQLADKSSLECRRFSDLRTRSSALTSNPFAMRSTSPIWRRASTWSPAPPPENSPSTCIRRRRCSTPPTRTLCASSTGPGWPSFTRTKEVFLSDRTLPSCCLRVDLYKSKKKSVRQQTEYKSDESEPHAMAVGCCPFPARLYFEIYISAIEIERRLWCVFLGLLLIFDKGKKDI